MFEEMDLRLEGNLMKRSVAYLVMSMLIGMTYSGLAYSNVSLKNGNFGIFFIHWADNFWASCLVKRNVFQKKYY